MTAPVGFLDFFVLEASDYVEQLDGLLQAGGGRAPDPDALQRTARALRGSATMAKLTAFADVAGGIERIGRALRENALPWDASLHGVLVAAVDDCKLLLRNVRNWGAPEEARARARAQEMIPYAPLRPATPLATPTTTGHDSFLATESSNIGAGLELLATRPTDRDAAANVLKRVRALRGLASLKDHPALADVLEAAELAAHPLELGAPALGTERISLLRAAATYVRAIATAIRTGNAIDAASPDAAAFTSALDALQERGSTGDAVLPIADFFYQDGGPTVVAAAPSPPTSPSERFRLEVVSQGEHLQRLVTEARQARDEPARERVRRALRQALRALKQAGESFGESEVARFVESHNEAVVRLDSRALDSLAEVATLLAQPGTASGSLSDRLHAMQAARTATPSAPAPIPTATAPIPAAPAPIPMMTPVIGSPIAPPDPDEQHRDRPAAAAVASAAESMRPSRQAPPTTTSALGALLDRGISTLDALPKTPLSTPVMLPEQPPVPIDALLYRGRAAAERAREIREALRGSRTPPDEDTLAELFDLIDLAITE